MAQQQTSPANAGQRHNGKQGSGATGAQHKSKTVACELTDIKVFCEHKEAAPKPAAAPKPPAPAGTHPPTAPPPATAAPPPEKKPGGPRQAKEEGAEKEEGKKAEAATPPPHPSALPPHPLVAPAPAAKPPAQHPAPAPPAVKALVLDVIPHTAEAEAPPTKKPFSFGLGEISFSQGAPTTGDKVTLKAVMSSHCSLHPLWKITEVIPSANNKPVGPPVPHLTGVQVTHQFLPHTLQKQTWWLEDIKPRCYEVKCVVHDKAPTAHHIVYVNVYPFVQAELKLTSESTKTPKNGWEKALAEVRHVVEDAFKEMAEVVPNLAKAEAKILEGELTLSNTWKENEEENTNLAHWQADIEAKLTILSLEVKIDLTEFSFLRKLKNAAEKFESYFTSATGGDIEAGMYLTVGGETTLTGKGSWEGGKPPHPESLKVAGSLKLGLKAELKAGYKGNGDLVNISGGGDTELIITGTPYLESGPKLWLDTELEWKPLHIHLEATLQPPHSRAKKTAPSGKLSPEQVEKDSKDKEGDNIGPSYDRDIFGSIKRHLGKITLLSEGAAQPAPAPKTR